MLYDNAQLAHVYLEAHQAGGDPSFLDVAEDVLEYVRREMTAPEGGFYSATDADSEGEEGKFFVWTPAEVREALGGAGAARRFCAAYDITEAGNFEGHNIPNPPRPLDDVAAELGLARPDLEASLRASRARLYEARARRVPPALDDKVLTAWNGLMIGAFAEGFRLTGDPRHLDAATRAAAFLRAQLVTKEGRLLRTWRAGHAHLDAYLEDYAYLAAGLLDLYEAGGDQAPPRGAERLARHYLPNRIMALHDPSEGVSDLPLLAGKATVAGRAALYVCRNFACQRPVTETSEVAAALAAGARESGERPRGGLAPSILPGAASPEATAALAHRPPLDATGYTTLGATGLVCSRLGFGGYRVDDETPAHRQALLDALGGGINLVDTSTNYTEGATEGLFGQALSEVARAGQWRREDLIVVSKVGYVQGENLERAQEREAAGRPLPEGVKDGEGIWHCIHPQCLGDQLTRSLARLQLETLDVCLLHNPEYFLMDAHERSYGTLDRRRHEFYGRLAASFACLEEEVRAGRIRAYGVSSNTCTRPANDPEATSLTHMLEAAVAGAGAGHHFRVLQLPLNLFEAG